MATRATTIPRGLAARHLILRMSACVAIRCQLSTLPTGVLFAASVCAVSPPGTLRGTGARLSAMTNAILSQYRVTMLTRGVEPLAQPVARVDVHSDPFSSEKLAILRDSDVLLMRIGQRSTEGEAAFEALARLLPRVNDLVYPP